MANSNAKVNRWFLRCVDCLAVSAVEQDPVQAHYWQGLKTHATNNAPMCECGGRNEIMGRVGSKDRFTALSLRCPCDSRCTNATGPNCDCSCAGVNHGTNRVVCVKVDAGGIPRTQAANVEAANEFRAAKEAAKQRLAKMPFAEDFAAGKFINDRAAWDAIRFERGRFAKAKALKTHKNRLAALAKVAA
jgi:hypothetical protein